MKLVKMLGLAMTAAIAAMAFIGTGTASAQLEHWVVLCKENPVELCPAGKLWKHIKLSSTVEKYKENLHAILLPSEGEITELCEKSTVSGSVTNTSPVHGEITGLTFGTCKPCTEVNAKNLNYLVEVHHDLVGEHLWLVLITKPASAVLVEFANCLGSKCFYKTEKVHLDVSNVNGHLLILTLENLLVKEGFGICAKEGKWDANYLVECLEPEKVKVNCWLALDVLKEA